MTHRVGEYDLVRRIGSGGMAEVWMGRRELVGGASKAVAIKFIAASMAGNDRHRKMFLDEARLSMLLSHSNVVQVFDTGTDGERLYMVMEWVDGLNLSQICQLARASGQALSMSLVGYAIGEVLQGLSYAHTLQHDGRLLGIVHRDISPHNVLVSLSGEVKLADFGVARLSTEETSGVHIKGKLRYMAPEHLAGRTKSPKVDLFGAGAILHELLEGDRFRADADEASLYHQILGGITPPLQRPDVPRELAELRLALLEPDENRRVASADDALAMLEAWHGYRNAKGELARLCRAFMGVDAPRSGLHLRPERSGVSPLADTESPTAPTHTADRGSRESTAPHGEGRTPQPADISTVHGTGSRLRPVARRSASLALGVGAAIAVAGASAYGVVTLLKGRRAGPLAQAQPVVVAEAPGSAGAGGAGDGSARTDSAAPAAAVAPAGGEAAAVGVAPAVEPAAVEPAAVEPAAVEPAAVEPAAVEPAAVEPAAVEPASSAKPPAAGHAPEPSGRSKTRGGKSAKPSSASAQPEPAAKLDVVFRVAPPMRYAWVRVDGGAGFAVEPRATRKLGPGSHAIDWRREESDPWVSGGRFDFAAGSAPTVRVTATGPRVE